MGELSVDSDPIVEDSATGVDPASSTPRSASAASRRPFSAANAHALPSARIRHGEERIAGKSRPGRRRSSVPAQRQRLVFFSGLCRNQPPLSGIGIDAVAGRCSRCLVRRWDDRPRRPVELLGQRLVWLLRRRCCPRPTIHWEHVGEHPEKLIARASAPFWRFSESHVETAALLTPAHQQRQPKPPPRPPATMPASPGLNGALPITCYPPDGLPSTPTAARDDYPALANPANQGHTMTNEQSPHPPAAAHEAVSARWAEAISGRGGPKPDQRSAGR